MGIVSESSSHLQALRSAFMSGSLSPACLFRIRGGGSRFQQQFLMSSASYLAKRAAEEEAKDEALMALVAMNMAMAPCYYPC